MAPNQPGTESEPQKAGRDQPTIKRNPETAPDWQERIERAKQAREDGRKARAGKPSTFPDHRSQA